MRLIDADALREGWLEWNPYEIIEANTVLDSIDEQPTIDPESLKPQGEWRRRKTSYSQTGFIDECSVCGNRLVHLGCKTNYCPNCGARMKGADHE